MRNAHFNGHLYRGGPGDVHPLPNCMLGYAPSRGQTDTCRNITFPQLLRAVIIKLQYKFAAGSLESANWSILAAWSFFKEVVGKKSGFYVN